jgi:hypothetical protein
MYGYAISSYWEVIHRFIALKLMEVHGLEGQYSKSQFKISNTKYFAFHPTQYADPFWVGVL